MNGAVAEIHTEGAAQSGQHEPPTATVPSQDPTEKPETYSPKPRSRGPKTPVPWANPEERRTSGEGQGDPCAPLLPDWRPLAQPPVRSESRTPRSRIKLLQQFEGTVLSLTSDSFTARLRDRTSPGMPTEIAEFERDEVDPSDTELLVVGGVFYWNIGYRLHPWGQRERASFLAFRRLPAWTRQDLRRVDERAASWESLFVDEAHDAARD